MVPAGSIAPERVEWLCPDRLARGKFDLSAGDGGCGKSQNAARLVAALTAGVTFPDGSPPAAKGHCLILAAEDGAKDTIIPRLIAAGADLSRVTILTARVTIKGKDGRTLISPMDFQSLEYWRAVLGRRPDALLLVADPLPAFLGRGVNDHRNAEVRAVLDPFIGILGERGVALHGITHVGKSVDARTPAHKILGSVAYANLARTVHVTLKDPESKGRHLLCQVKNNLGPLQPAVAYRIAEHHIDHGGATIRTARLEYEEKTVDVDPTQLMDADRARTKRGPKPRKTNEVAEWLYDHLTEQGRPVPLAAILDAAGEKGFVGQKQDNGRWSSPANIYRAKDVVPSLPEPKGGYRVEELSMPVREGGRNTLHWYLCTVGAEF
jgi:putative DNA primase/helicase